MAVQRMAVARGIGVAHEVDGIGEARRRRQRGGEAGRAPAPRRAASTSSSRIPRGIGRDDAEPAPIGHDEEPAAARGRGWLASPRATSKRLLDGTHAKRPRLLDRRVERAIGTRKRSGM